MPSPPPSDARSDSPPLILSHQKSAFERLVAIGRACFGVQRNTLPVRLRTHSLIVGPTGTGKTFLARAVAKELGLGAKNFLPLSVSEWVLLSCTRRAAMNTWTTICKFLLSNKSSDGVIIFLDELDKLNGQCDYEQFQRTEVFQLLDLTLPTGLVDDEGDPIGELDLAAAREVLSNRTFLIGAGAFQQIWETRSTSCIGFHERLPDPQPLALGDLAQTLPRELINRFRRELLILPQLQHRDYIEMLESTAVRVPSYLRDGFLRIGHESISGALEMNQGCRFLEDTLLEAILAERRSLKVIPTQEKRHARQTKFRSEMNPKLAWSLFVGEASHRPRLPPCPPSHG